MKYLASLLITYFTCVAAQCTTICWDGKTLAADSQATCGHHKTWVTKIVRSEDRHASMAFAGCDFRGRLIMAYFMNCTDPLSKMDLPDSDREEDAVDVLVVFDSGEALYYGGDLKHISIVQAPFTIGAGGDIALGALASGKTAEEAVQLAEDHDIFTGGKILVFEAPKKESDEDKNSAVQGLIDKLKELQTVPKDSEPKQ